MGGACERRGIEEEGKGGRGRGGRGGGAAEQKQENKLLGARFLPALGKIFGSSGQENSSKK